GGYDGFAPSFLANTTSGSDLIEVTNLGTSPVDPSGVTLEVWLASATSPAKIITIPAGAAPVPPGGNVFFMWANNIVDLTNNYYTGSNSNDWDDYTSTGAVGFVLKKNGVIFDAMASNSLTFPAASGVT